MANNIRTLDALQSLKPGAEWTLRDEELKWLDTVQTEPTQSELDTEIIRLQGAYDALEYTRNRKEEYPSIEECVHAILDDELDALQAKRAEIKLKYPK